MNLSSSVLTKARIYSSVSRRLGEDFSGHKQVCCGIQITELGTELTREAPPSSPLLC